jgi:hypothetical protein
MPGLRLEWFLSGLKWGCLTFFLYFVLATIYVITWGIPFEGIPFQALFLIPVVPGWLLAVRGYPDSDWRDAVSYIASRSTGWLVAGGFVLVWAFI